MPDINSSNHQRVWHVVFLYQDSIHSHQIEHALPRSFVEQFFKLTTEDGVQEGENPIKYSYLDFERCEIIFSAYIVCWFQLGREQIFLNQLLLQNVPYTICYCPASLAGWQALLPLLWPQKWPSSVLLCQPRARLSEGTLPDSSLVFIVPWREMLKSAKSWSG